MSFYLDDDGVAMGDTRTGGNEGDRSESGFICDNCGGNESYLDENSGGLICINCFTQSQTMIAASQERIEFEDAMVLAGRISGRLKSSSLYVKRGPRLRKRLADMDRSAPLPKVEQCLLGFQRILKESTAIVAELMDCPPDVTKVAMKTCRTIWKAYLTSWMQGADYYGAIYPEVRFCFRDMFLNDTLRRNVLRTLTHQASKKIREDVKSQSEIHLDEMSHVVMGLGDINETNNNNNNDGEFEIPVAFVVPDENPFTTHDDDATQASNVGSPLNHFNPIARMIVNHQRLIRKKTLGRKATALYISPSIELVAAIVCMTFHPYGVTCANIRDWIETGRLPLLNAFPMLIPHERKQLKLIKTFFRLAEPPSIYLLETLVASLKVACGYKPSKVVVRKTHKKEMLGSIDLFTKQPSHHLTPRSLPLVTARIVAQLGLSQTVLNFSLALMGIPFIPDRAKLGPKHRIPRALRACRADKIVAMSKLLGVVVTACKYIPRWEDHWFEKSTYSDVVHTTQGSDLVPWNQAESHQLYGSCSEAHLELFERKIMKIDNSLLFSEDNPAGLYTNPFHNNDDNDDDDDDTKEADSKIAVLPCATVIRLHPSCREKPHHSRMKGVLFEEIEDNIQGIIPAPPLGTLIEYVAAKTGSSPMEILKFHLKLGQEMQRRAKRHDERMAEKKRELSPCAFKQNTTDTGTGSDCPSPTNP